MRDTIWFYPYNEKPITHTIVVSSPIQLRRWTTSEQLANEKAEEYRQRGWTVTIEPMPGRKQQ